MVTMFLCLLKYKLQERKMSIFYINISMLNEHKNNQFSLPVRMNEKMVVCSMDALF